MFSILRTFEILFHRLVVLVTRTPLRFSYFRGGYISVAEYDQGTRLWFFSLDCYINISHLKDCLRFACSTLEYLAHL